MGSFPDRGMMRVLVFLSLISLLTLATLPMPVRAQTIQSHVWSKRFGSTAFDEGRGVAVDSIGNVVVTGSFYGTVDFGGGGLTSGGDRDIFVAKFSGVDGSHLWSKRFGRTGDDYGIGVVVDGSDNVVVTGFFASTVDFGGGGGLTGEGFTSAGSSDIFVAKFSGPNGSHIWSKRFGSTGKDVGDGLAVDSNGNVVVTGSFTGTVNFGGGGLTSRGILDEPDIFVAKFSGADGSHFWSKRFGSFGDDYAPGVAVDGTDNVVMTGAFRHTVDFGGGGLTSTGSRDNVAGLPDIFLAKFSGADGAHIWSRRFGDFERDYGYGVAVDGSGNVVVTGSFRGTVDFGGGGLTSVGQLQYADIFLAKFSGTDGSHLWAQRFGSIRDDMGYGVEVDGGGNVVMTGPFSDTVDFGGGGLSTAGNFDIFVAQFFGTDGSHLWSKRFGSTGSDVGYGVATDGSGNVVVAGFFTGTVDFGGGATISAGGVDAFVVKLTATSQVAPAIQSDTDIMNNASYRAASASVAPGTIVAIFGTNLTDGRSCLQPNCYPTFESNGRLNTTLAGAQVMVSGIPAPILYAYPFQIGIQIPIELTGATASLQVAVGGQTSVPRTIFLDALAPGIFTSNNQGTGAAAFTHANGAAISPQNPARAGEVVILYATGLGAVSPAAQTGAVPAGESRTVSTPTVLIDGIPAEVQFSGLSGCCVGLNQLNVIVPPSTRSGNEIPVVLSIGGKQSNSVTIAVAP